ncbi:MAG TPA: TolC family protein, partial [Anaeromyxobacteraceae bacterium]|nr:TolC family protein [Anaeromyxobacteraceae bacterium]
LRSLVAELEKNQTLAEAALANTLGLPWSSSVRPADKEIPFAPFWGDLDELVETAYHFNPDWAKVLAGIRAAEGAVRTAKSDFFPKLAATGEGHRWWNSYDAGLATSDNTTGWSVGAGIELPLFSGFLTKNKVDETRAVVEKAKEGQLLLKDGIGIEIKDAFLSLAAAGKAFQSTRDAMDAAAQSSDLTTRAYQNGIVETDKVIRAQLVEALMTAQHLKARYDHIAAKSQIHLLVGRDLGSDSATGNGCSQGSCGIP